MKQRLVVNWVSLALLVSIIGCSGGVGIQDKPLPMSQENIEKFATELEKAAKSIAPSPSEDGAELLVSAYKIVLEKKMGFSFDKTLRSVMLFYPEGAPWQLMSPVIGYVHSDLKRALDKGFISQRTFDIFDTGLKSKGVLLTDKGMEFIGFVEECQNKNNGYCDPDLLLGVIVAHNALSDAGYSFDTDDTDGTVDAGDMKKRRMGAYIEQKYTLPDMGRNRWITKPDGKEINTNGLWAFGSSADKFVVNKNQIDISKRYANMIAEEKVTLSQ